MNRQLKVWNVTQKRNKIKQAVHRSLQVSLPRKRQLFQKLKKRTHPVIDHILNKSAGQPIGLCMFHCQKKSQLFQKLKKKRTHPFIHRLNKSAGQSTVDKCEHVGVSLSSNVTKVLRQMDKDITYQKQYCYINMYSLVVSGPVTVIYVLHCSSCLSLYVRL